MLQTNRMNHALDCTDMIPGGTITLPFPYGSIQMPPRARFLRVGEWKTLISLVMWMLPKISQEFSSVLNPFLLIRSWRCPATWLGSTIFSISYSLLPSSRMGGCRGADLPKKEFTATDFKQETQNTKWTFNVTRSGSLTTTVLVILWIENRPKKSRTQDLVVLCWWGKSLEILFQGQINLNWKLSGALNKWAF